MKERQLLRDQFGIEKIDPRQVAARPGEACDEAEPHWIVADEEEDRGCRGCRLCRQCGGGTSTHEHHGDLPANQVSHQFRHLIDFIFCPAVDDRYVVTFHVTGFCEPLTKSPQTAPPSRRGTLCQGTRSSAASVAARAPRAATLPLRRRAA